MTQAYSEDLRARALSRADRGETIRSIAAALQISPSCVSKWRKLRRETGDLKPGKMNGHKKRVLSGPHAEWLRERNASAIGTLVERKSRYTLIAKMKDCGAQAALDGFTKAFAKAPKMMRRSLAYDQGKEMARHKELTSRLGMPVYFCDPHSPWQRPSNENLNGLVRQYLPKGIDLSIYSQRDLDRIAHSLNTRPRAVLGFQTPEEVFMAELSKLGDTLQI